MTHINPDDPKWTAYILGELEDTERAAIELEIESSEEARSLVEELRLTADLTKVDLRRQVPIVPLTSQERERIQASAGIVRPRRWFRARPAVWVAGLAAACVVLAAVSPMLLRSRIQMRAVPAAVVEEARQSEDSTAPATDDQTKAASEFAPRYEHPTPAPVVPQTAAEPRSQPNSSETPAPGLKDVDQKSVNAIQFSANSQAERQNTLQAGQVDESAPAGGIADKLANVPPAPVGQGPQGQQNQQGQQGGAFRFAEERAPGVVAGAGGGTGTGVRTITRSGLNTVLLPAPVPEPPPPLSTPTAPGVPPAFDRRPPRGFPGTEAYEVINDNPFLAVAQNPLSTFSIDVDTASYSNVRRYLNQYQLPPRDAVRIEEMINYFAYDYPQPSGKNPIGAAIEAASAPWNPQHRLVRIGVKARDVAAGRRPPSNLVFLLDVSGSMQPAERLPLLKEGLRMLVEQLTANDRVTIVTYAGTTGIALKPTRGDQKDVILSLIDSLQAGGSTNGGSGIQLAYDQAMANFIPGGVNRVILATDGDFNVGITDRNTLLRLIEDKARSGVFLSVLGVGMGNYKDATLEMLADKGNGNYAYLDTLNEARKVFVDQMTSTLVTVAKDVKVQVEFNPAVVDAYRLIGYENRALRNEDFNNDLKDAGDMGAGHTVTVLYEVVPRGVGINAPGVDPLKYQQPAVPLPAGKASNETLTVKIRYKEPAGSESKLLVFPLVDREQTFARASADFRFAAAVASFGMIMRESPFKGTSTFDSVLTVAEDSLGSDRNGYRREFLQLVQRARQIRR